MNINEVQKIFEDITNTLKKINISEFQQAGIDLYNIADVISEPYFKVGDIVKTFQEPHITYEIYKVFFDWENEEWCYQLTNQMDELTLSGIGLERIE